MSVLGRTGRGWSCDAGAPEKSVEWTGGALPPFSSFEGGGHKRSQTVGPPMDRLRGLMGGPAQAASRLTRPSHLSSGTPQHSASV